MTMLASPAARGWNTFTVRASQTTASALRRDNHQSARRCNNITIVITLADAETPARMLSTVISDAALPAGLEGSGSSLRDDDLAGTGSE